VESKQKKRRIEFGGFLYLLWNKITFENWDFHKQLSEAGIFGFEDLEMAEFPRYLMNAILAKS
jgi:hypothetical protein